MILTEKQEKSVEDWIEKGVLARLSSEGQKVGKPNCAGAHNPDHEGTRNGRFGYHYSMRFLNRYPTVPTTICS